MRSVHHNTISFSIIQCHSYELFLILYIAFAHSLLLLSHLCFTIPLKNGWKRNVIWVETQNVLNPCNSRPNSTLTLTTYFYSLPAVLPASSTPTHSCPVSIRTSKGSFKNSNLIMVLSCLILPNEPMSPTLLSMFSRPAFQPHQSLHMCIPPTWTSLAPCGHQKANSYPPYKTQHKYTIFHETCFLENLSFSLGKTFESVPSLEGHPLRDALDPGEKATPNLR